MLFKKIINAVLAVLILIGALGNYASPYVFAFFAVLCAGAAVWIDLGGLRHAPVRHSARRLILPALFCFGLFGVSLAVSAAWMRWIVVVLGVVLFYFYQIYFPEELPKNGEEGAVLGSAALLFILIWSLNFYFPHAWYVPLLLVLGVSLPLFFYFLPLPESLAGALMMTEAAWALLYWPTHFITTAAVNFTLFYLIYVLRRLHGRGRLTARQVYFQAGTAGLLLLIVLASSPWRPQL